MNKTWQQYLMIILITIFAFAWRIQLFAHNNIWTGDIGRDMLAGHLILKENIQINQGHANSGINSNYPSLYYHFIAGVTALGQDNYFKIANLLIFYQSISIILLFILIKNSFSFPGALLVSLFYAFGTRGINFSLFPISAHNSIPLLLSSALFLQYGLKKRNLLLLAFSALFLAICTTFFYGAILIFPLYLGLVLLETFDKKIIWKSLKASLIFSTVFALAFLSLFAKVNDYGYPFYNLIGSGLRNLQLTQFSFTNIFTKLHFQNSLLHVKGTYLFYPIYAWAAYIALKNKTSKKKALLFLAILLMNLALYAAHKHTLQHYLIYIHLLLLYLWGFILQKTLIKNKILFVILGLIFLRSAEFFHNYKHINSVSYQHYQKVSQLIARQTANKSIVFFGNCLENPIEKNKKPWESRSFWYFQKETPEFFELNDDESQINLVNPQQVALCYLYAKQKNNTLKNFSFNFQVDDKLYYTYDYEH